MRPATALLLALSSSLAAGTPVRGAAAGGPAWCTVDTAAQGAALYQRTKDCCAASGGSNARFNEVDELCEGILGTIDNGVDWGQFSKCCNARGGGSSGCKPATFPFTCKPNGKIHANWG